MIYGFTIILLPLFFRTVYIDKRWLVAVSVVVTFNERRKKKFYLLFSIGIEYMVKITQTAKSVMYQEHKEQKKYQVAG